MRTILILLLTVTLGFSQTLIPVTGVSTNRICSSVNDTNCFTNNIVASTYDANGVNRNGSWCCPLWQTTLEFTITNGTYVIESIETTNGFLIYTNYVYSDGPCCEKITNVGSLFTNNLIFWQVIHPAIVYTNTEPTNVTYTVASIWEKPYYRVRMR